MSNLDKIKQIVQSTPNGLTAGEISKQLNYICTDTVRRNTSKLLEQGLIERVKSGNKYRYLPKTNG